MCVHCHRSEDLWKGVLRVSRHGRSDAEYSEDPWEPIVGVNMKDASGSLCGLCNFEITPGFAEETAAVSFHATVIALHV